MKKVTKHLLLTMMAMVSIGLADENNYISDTTKTTENQTQTSQTYYQSDSGVKHRFGIGLGYGFQSIASQQTTGYSPKIELKLADNFNSIYVLGNYQILYPSKKNSHITNGVEFIAGLGYASMHQRVKTYRNNSLTYNERSTDTYSAFNLDFGALGVSYRQLSSSLSLGFKVGLGYSMQYVPNNGSPILNNSYGVLLGAEIDTSKIALGILCGYYFGVHQSQKIGNTTISGSTWSLIGDGVWLYSNKVQVYALYRF